MLFRDDKDVAVAVVTVVLIFTAIITYQVVALVDHHNRGGKEWVIE